jgi:hypothetical protein
MLMSLTMSALPIKIDDVLGRAPERLTLPQRMALTGKWIALEVYSPQTLPLKVIEAVGRNPSECIRQLEERGLDPRAFEFSKLPAPF